MPDNKFGPEEFIVGGEPCSIPKFAKVRSYEELASALLQGFPVQCAPGAILTEVDYSGLEFGVMAAEEDARQRLINNLGVPKELFEGPMVTTEYLLRIAGPGSGKTDIVGSLLRSKPQARDGAGNPIPPTDPANLSPETRERIAVSARALLDSITTRISELEEDAKALTPEDPAPPASFMVTVPVKIIPGSAPGESE